MLFRSVAAIMMIVFRFTMGSAFNLGTDFTGGYSVDIKLGNKLNEENRQTYYGKIEEVFTAVKAANDKTYKVEISGAMQSQGSGDTASIRVKYSQVKGVSESEMSRYVNPAIISALEEKVLNKVPSIDVKDNVITLTYDEVINADGDNNPLSELKTAFLNIVGKLNSDIGANITVDESSIVLNEENKKQIFNSILFPLSY